MGSLSRDTPLSGHPQYDLGEWMINQQRQFQEFDRSFDRTFHTTPGFGNTFGDFFSPFSRPNLALQSSQQQLPPPPTPAYPTPPWTSLVTALSLSRAVLIEISKSGVWILVIVIRAFSVM